MAELIQIFLLFGIGIGSFFVLFSRNPVHSVLFLILVFICGAGVLLLFGAEFIALIFIIVYVGAIAVLFLFIVMMVNIKINKESGSLMQYLPFGLLFGVLFLTEIFASLEALFANKEPLFSSFPKWLNFIDPLTNTELLGQILYQEFFICFVLCGILLLIAMLGAIVLTQRFLSKRTNEIAPRQLSRNEQTFFSFAKK